MVFDFSGATAGTAYNGNCVKFSRKLIVELNEGIEPAANKDFMYRTGTGFICKGFVVNKDIDYIYVAQSLNK